MEVARKAFLGLAWLFVLGVAIQFFLAGLGVMGGEKIDAHEAFGHVLTIVTVALLVLAVAGRMGRVSVGGSAVLFLLVFLQSLWVQEFKNELLGSIHVLAALFIFAIGHFLAQRAARLNRGEITL
jgi:hypothetical protein